MTTRERLVPELRPPSEQKILAPDHEDPNFTAGTISSVRSATWGSSETRSLLVTVWKLSRWHFKLILNSPMEAFRRALGMGRCTPCWSARPQKLDWC